MNNTSAELNNPKETRKENHIPAQITQNTLIETAE